jgi:hypothetical protein
MPVGAGEHLPIAPFDAGKVPCKPLEIIWIAPSSHGGEHVVHREKQPLLGQVSEQADQIVAAAADLAMLPFGQVINAHMDMSPAGHPASDFLTDKEVRVPSQLFGATDGVVVGQREKVHAALSQHSVDLRRWAVAFQKKMAQNSHGQSSRVSRVNVQVAFHGGKIVSKYV